MSLNGLFAKQKERLKQTLLRLSISTLIVLGADTGDSTAGGHVFLTLLVYGLSRRSQTVFCTISGSV